MVILLSKNNQVIIVRVNINQLSNAKKLQNNLLHLNNEIKNKYQISGHVLTTKLGNVLSLHGIKMKLVCILLLLSFVLLHLTAVKDADDGCHKEASSHQCPSCHKHCFARGDEQFAHPTVRMFPWIWNHYQLRIGDDLGEATA